MRPHLLARVARAEGGPDDGVGDGHCDGTEDRIRESSAVRINLAGSLIFWQFIFWFVFLNYVRTCKNEYAMINKNTHK